MRDYQLSRFDEHGKAFVHPTVGAQSDFSLRLDSCGSAGCTNFQQKAEGLGVCLLLFSKVIGLLA